MEALAFALVLLTLALFGFALRLAQAPVDLGFAKGYILSALSDPTHGVQVDVRRLQLSWPALDNEIFLDLDGVSLKSTVGARFTMDHARVGVAKAPLLIGIIRPETITLREPRLRFTRNPSEHKDVAVSGEEDGNAFLNFIGATLIDWRDGRDTMFNRLRKISIENAHIRYRDPVQGWVVNLFNADVSFAREGGQNLVYRASIPGGVVENTKLFAETIVIDTLVLDGRYDRKRKEILLDTPTGTIAGLPIKLQGLFEQKNTRFVGSLVAKLDKLETDKLDALWPQSLSNNSAHEWLVTKLSGGTIHDFKADLPLGFHVRDDGFSLSIGLPDMSFAFENLSVDYRPPLTPYISASGQAKFSRDNLEVTSAGGKIGALAVTKARVYLDRLLEENVGDAAIDVALTGPLRDVLEYTAKDPVRLDKKFAVDLTQVKGAGEYNVAIRFPALPDVLAQQVKVDVVAKVSGVTIPDVVNGLALTDAALDLKTEGPRAIVTGSGKILERDVDFTWTRALELIPGDPIKGALTASISSDAALRAVFDADLQEVRGTVPLKLDMTQKHDGTGTIELLGNLGPAYISIPALGYIKPEGLKGEFTARLLLEKETLKQAQNLRVETDGLTIADTTLNYATTGKAGRATLKDGRIGRLQSGVTDVQADFKMLAADHLSIIAKGPKVDLRPFFKPDRTGGTGADAHPASDRITLKLTTPHAVGDEEEAVKGLALTIDLNRYGTMTGLDLTGTVGTGPVKIYYRPDGAATQKFTLSAADAGAMLRAFDVYPNVLGGTLEMSANPMTPGARDLKGELNLRDFSVVKAPFLAQLIAALSLQGLDAALQGKEGLSFTKLQSGFEWYTQDKGSVYVFRDGRTGGSSLGLTFEGKADQKAGTVDIAGTIVPMSEVNTLVANIPIIGEILAGKKGSGIFAATYSITGPSDNPKTLVNPLAVLTPGILRKILFEREVKAPKPGDQTPANLPKKSIRNE